MVTLCSTYARACESLIQQTYNLWETSVWTSERVWNECEHKNKKTRENLVVFCKIISQKGQRREHIVAGLCTPENVQTIMYSTGIRVCTMYGKPGKVLNFKILCLEMYGITFWYQLHFLAKQKTQWKLFVSEFYF